VIGDSLTSTNGNAGSVEMTFTTNGVGTITGAALTDAGSGFGRDFSFSIRGSNSSGTAGAQSVMAWFDITTTAAGQATGIAFNRQSAAFPINLTDEAVTQASDGIESWVFQLWNDLALNGEIDSMPATSYARPSTGFAYSAVPTAASGDIALVWLGGNDVGGIDIGDGFGPDGTTAADLTPAQLETACDGMFADLITKGYRVIVVKAAFNDFDLILSQPRWVTGTNIVNDAIQDAMATNGLIEFWDLPTSNTADGLHPSQAGHDFLKQGAYPRMGAVSSGFPDGIFSTTGEFTTKVLVGAGTASLPSSSFIGDPDTGAFNSVANAYDITTGGTVRATFSFLGLAMTVPLDMGNKVIQNVLDPTTTAHVGDTGFNDIRYVNESDHITAGVAVAGGKIISDGSGAQDVTNTFGVASATISGSVFAITLDNAIATDDDMVLIATATIGISQITAQTARVSDTVFNVALVNTSDTALTTSGLFFSFAVYDAGA